MNADEPRLMSPDGPRSWLMGQVLMGQRHGWWVKCWWAKDMTDGPRLMSHENDFTKGHYSTIILDSFFRDFRNRNACKSWF